MSTTVQRALAVYSAHRWSATTRLCACGRIFPATFEGNQLHKEHRMEETLKVATEVFCDRCAGPYDYLMEQYGGHWDTCPNRAKALPPVGETFEERFGEI